MLSDLEPSVAIVLVMFSVFFLLVSICGFLHGVLNKINKLKDADEKTPGVERELKV